MPSEPADKYDLRVPRYTSYPTAPHFAADVDATRYQDWLAALDPATPLSLYLHVPFCDEMCWFCGCHTKVVRRYEPIAAYLRVVHREIEQLARALSARMPVRHVHWGGGSPSLLAPADWLAMIAALRRHFDVAADAEVAVELDPRDAREDYVAALASAGVNRASIGVQDFDADVQAAINRVQPFAVVEQVTGWLRRHGIVHLNLDLMYGLPRQTVARLSATIEQALSLRPTRVALFGYAHVPWMKAHQRLIDEAELPGAVERLRQFSAASRLLQQAGYRAIGLDHFAAPDDPLALALDGGRLRRNFQGYTTDEAPVLLGLGASAIGTLPQGYVQNAPALPEYRRAIEAGRLATVRGIALDADDRLRRAVIERLMCTLAVDLDALGREHGLDCDPFAAERAQLAPMAADGLLTIEGSRIRVTEAGRPFVRVVAAAFDTYWRRGEARHSRSI